MTAILAHHSHGLHAPTSDGAPKGGSDALPPRLSGRVERGRVATCSRNMQPDPGNDVSEKRVWRQLEKCRSRHS